MKVECYASSLTQQGRSRNEDAFLIVSEPFHIVAVCDGVGDAGQAARKCLNLFQPWIRNASPQDVLLLETWVKWLKMLDSALSGGHESTFLGVAVLNGALIGVSAGDSRAYLFSAEGELRPLTASGGKARLGSGEAKPFTFGLTLRHRDIILLMTDGAWTPLNPYIMKKIIGKAVIEHFSEVPTALLNAASRTGRWDDMTVAALRLTV